MRRTDRIKSGPDAGVRVYNMKVFRQLVADTPDHPRREIEDPGPKKLTAEEARAIIREENFERMQKVQAARLAETLRNKKIAKDLKREKKFDGMVTELGDGKPFTDSIDKFLTVTEAADTTKKEALYGEWQTGVFDKLQRSVNQTIESVDRKALNKKKNEDFQKFLDATNNTGGVFLETVFDGDTEPASAHSLKARVGKVKDPVRLSLNKHNQESELAGRPKHAPKERATLDARQWADGKIQATPFGHFAHFVGKEHKPTEMQKMMTKSKVSFDAYNYPTDGHSKDTFPSGKKTYPDKGNYSSTVYPTNGPWAEK